MGSLEKVRLPHFFAKLQKHTNSHNSLQLKRTLTAVKHQQHLFIFTQITIMWQIIDIYIFTCFDLKILLP